MYKCGIHSFRRAFVLKAVGVLMASLSVLLPMSAQVGISNWSLSVSDAANSSDDGITYSNTTHAVTSFTTASETYILGPTATSVFVRRNTDSSGNGVHNQVGVDNNNRSSTFQAQNGSATQVLGTYQTNLTGMLLNNNVLMGVDNLFARTNDTTKPQSGNIERVDFYFGATVVSANQGITLFERGIAATDDVKIAVFTSWNSGSGAPITYSGNVVTVNNTHYGSALDLDPLTGGAQTTRDYTTLRFANGNDLTTLDATSSVIGTSITGSFISFADLGIATGTTIYGYSLITPDATSNIANLADWTNATYYPTNTGGSTTIGGIDLVSFNGTIAKPVPEPSTYGAILLGGCLGVWWLRRRSSSAAAA
jgi:hypothetical protein